MKTKDTKTRRKPDPRQARRAAEEKERQRRKAAQKKRKKPLDSDIVYTQVAPFALSTFLLRLLTAVAIVAALLIGICTCGFSAVGVKIGNVFGSRYEKKAQFCGGVILILLGLKILLEHLGVL